MTMRADPPIVTFASGELSPKMMCRTDTKQFLQGLRYSENFTVMPHGGLTRRPGTYFVAEVKNSSVPCRLIPFQYSIQQTYMIEAGNQYFRFYANSGRVESPPGSPIELATPWTTADLPDLQYAQTADVLYVVHPDYLPRKITRLSPTSFSISTVNFSNSRAPILSYNPNPDNYAVVTGTWPNLTITLGYATFAASDVGRTFYIKSNKDKQSYYCTIVGFTSAFIVTATGIYRFSDTVGHPTGTDADLWAFGAMDATHGCSAVAFHEGRLMYAGFDRAPDMMWLSVVDDFDNFELSSPDAATTDAENADKAIQRRCISGQVNSVRWGASGGNNLVVGTSGAEFRLKPANDDNLAPLTASLKRATQRGVAALPPVIIDNTIYFMDRSEAVLRRLKYNIVDDNEQAADASILAEHLLLPGVWEMTYLQAPIPTIWMALNNGKLVGWSIENDQEVQAAHSHILGGNYRGGSAFVESIGVVPNTNISQNAALEDQLWLVVQRTIDGATKRYVEFMTAYFRPNLHVQTPTTLQKITATEDAFFVDCGLALDIPLTVSGISADTSAVVTSTAHGLSNGDTVRFRRIAPFPDASMVELFDHRRFTVSAVTTNTFIPLDITTGIAVNTVGLQFVSGFVYKEANMFSGLSHLEGEEVSVLIDGKIHPNVVVTDGAIVTDLRGSKVVVGLPYQSAAETMPILGMQGRGSDQGYPKQFGQMAISLMDTIGGEYGRGSNPREWESLIFESTASPMDYGPIILTGNRLLKISGSTEDLPTINMRQTQALPMTVLGLYPRLWQNND